LLQCRYSFDLKLRYIKSKLNVCADALSRDDLRTFFQYMHDNFNLRPDELVRVPVQNTLRNSLVSSMILMPRSTDSTPTQPSGGRNPQIWCGRGSVDGTGAS
jgi:hypothetical protein